MKKLFFSLGMLIVVSSANAEPFAELDVVAKECRQLGSDIGNLQGVALKDFVPSCVSKVIDIDLQTDAGKIYVATATASTD